MKNLFYSILVLFGVALIGSLLLCETRFLLGIGLFIIACCGAAYAIDKFAISLKDTDEEKPAV